MPTKFPNVCALIAFLSLALLSATPLSAADAANAAEAKLREGLRNTMLQMRTLQTERDALQAAKTQLEQEKQALTQQVAETTKRLAADKEAADKTTADLKARVAEQGEEMGRLKESLEKWKLSQKQAAELAATKEAERARFAMQVIELQRRVADQQVKNAAMFKIGNEILVRYEKFGLGTALTAREPFVGTMRVKLQNLVQDYGDKLAEQRIKP